MKTEKIKSDIHDVYKCYYNASWGIYFYEMMHQDKEFRRWLEQGRGSGWYYMEIEGTFAFLWVSAFYHAIIKLCAFKRVVETLKGTLKKQTVSFERKDNALNHIENFLQSFHISEEVKKYRDKVIAHPNMWEFLKAVPNNILIKGVKRHIEEMREFLAGLKDHIQDIVIIDRFPDNRMEKPDECILTAILQSVRENAIPLIEQRLAKEEEEKKRKAPVTKPRT